MIASRGHALAISHRCDAWVCGAYASVMRKSLVLLAFVSLFAACAAEPTPTSAPTPDIEATVEARTAEETSRQAEIDAAVAKASEAVVTPTPTPIPPMVPLATATPTSAQLETPSINYLELAEQYAETEQWEKVIEACTKAIEFKPRDAECYLGRAQAYSVLYKYQDALDDLNIAINLPAPIPNTPMSSDDLESNGNEYLKYNFSLISYLSFELGLLDDAILNIDHYLDAGEKTNTVSEVARYSETHKSIQWLIEGNEYLASGLYAKAIESFTAFIDCSWNGPPAVEYLTDRIFPKGCGEGRYPHNMFLNVTEADPQGSHPVGYFRRGIALGRSGEFEEAIADFKQVIALDPNNSRKYSQKAYKQKGIAYGGLGEYERAIQDFDETIHLDPEHAGTYANRGLTYYKLAQYARAIQDYDEAIRLNPEFAYAYYHRGGAYWAMGDSEAAARDLAKAKELGYAQ
jgi:tetratricopeptide (TPR) repeat protein